MRIFRSPGLPSNDGISSLAPTATSIWDTCDDMDLCMENTALDSHLEKDAKLDDLHVPVDNVESIEEASMVDDSSVEAKTMWWDSDLKDGVDAAVLLEA
ncbi:unnamed protein product [Protopolystoma xenopodis]|uniref:Uncharacterized protein n=1 Tax=Protopolystoma xenopodis TaxID=117903 RepID=A0A448XNK3_9PLAT|nr:unnamed protein product [Protopolystoma xenopodis]